MDNATFYEMIFKRKSFHLFRGVGDEKITDGELDEIMEAWNGFEPLCPEIKTAIRIVPSSRVNFKRDAEYCILIYSEKKDNYLANAGYLGEALDLWLVSHNIGTLWYGIGKPDEATCDGLDFVIMIAVRKVSDGTKYRRDMYKAKRKPLADVWSGEDEKLAAAALLARFAPSACNTQPWYVREADGKVTVSRYRTGKLGIMPRSSASYFNRIDIGIFTFILEVCMKQNGIAFERTLFTDPGGEDEYTKLAEYIIK